MLIVKISIYFKSQLKIIELTKTRFYAYYIS